MNKDNKIDTKHAILLVMDYQNGIVKQVPGAEAIVDLMTDTLNEARKAGLAIGYVRVAFTDDDYKAVPETNKSFRAVAENRNMHNDSQDTQIHNLVAPHAGDVIVRKTRVGAFSTTDLDEQLKAKDINTLILAGFSTSGVMLSTIREAADWDYKIYVLEDLSIDPDQEVHDMLMQKIFPRQTHVIKQANLLDLLKA